VVVEVEYKSTPVLCKENLITQIKEKDKLVGIGILQLSYLLISGV
jgi:hypothetical protein